MEVMNEMRILYLFIFLLLLPSVYAFSGGAVGENTTLWCTITDQPNFFAATAANITIKSPEAKVIVSNQPMVENGTGQFYYKFIPNQTGQFFSYCYFYNATGNNIAIAQETVSVGGIMSAAFSEIWIVFLIFCIGILLTVIGQYIKNPLFHMSAGIWFIINGYISLNNINGLGTYSMIYFFLIGVALLWHGINLFIAVRRDTTDE